MFLSILEKNPTNKPKQNPKLSCNLVEEENGII